jgi:hypothetical protein
MNLNSPLWVFVLAICAGSGWAVGHWIVGKIAAGIDRALS